MISLLIIEDLISIFKNMMIVIYVKHSNLNNQHYKVIIILYQIFILTNNINKLTQQLIQTQSIIKSSLIIIIITQLLSPFNHTLPSYSYTHTHNQSIMQNYARLTFTQFHAPTQQIFKTISAASFKCIGTQTAQVQYLYQIFVRQKQWVSPTQFKQMRELCWALPGPTVIQLVVSLTMLLTKSPLVGFISFIIFTIPSVLVLSVLGWLASQYATPHTQFPTQVKLILLGFTAAAASIMMSSFISHFKTHYENPAKLIIMISSALIFLNWRTVRSITFCLVAGAIISLYMEIETKKKMSSKSQFLLRDAKLSWIFGRNSVIILISLYILLWIWFEIYPHSHYVYTFVFYFVGCFVIGPISTIFAYFYANFTQLAIIQQQQFWLGVPFSFMLPGSIINVGIYYGSLIDGFKGTVLSACFMYLPCFLALCGILPQWRYYRDKPGIQRLIIGITCVTNGLCFSVIVMALEYIIKIDVSMTICIFIVCFFLADAWNLYPFMIIIIGGLLANVRRWGLIYYRFMPDHKYL